MERNDKAVVKLYACMYVRSYLVTEVFQISLFCLL
jgi:hypothetical protein